MSAIYIEIRRDDLRTIVALLKQDQAASAVGMLAAIFVDADDIEAHTLGRYLEDIEGLADDEGC